MDLRQFSICSFSFFVVTTAETKISMRLNSSQKNYHYIKNNIDRLSAEELVAHLGISKKKVKKIIKKINFEKNDNKSKIENANYSADAILNQNKNPFYHLNFFEFFERNKIIFFLLTLLVAIAYINSLGNDFVSDDMETIVSNPNIYKFTNIFLNNPVGYFERTVFFLTANIFGLKPWAFRLPNILFHLGSTWIIFIIICQMINRKAAVITSSLFAIHPFLSEPIVWISGAPYVEYSFFFSFFFFYYLRFSSERQKKHLFFSVLFYLLALLSSDKAISLFFAYPLYEWIKESSKTKIKATWPFAALGIVAAAFYLSFLGKRTTELSTGHSYDSGLFNPLIQIPVATMSYLWLIFWPNKLSLYQTEMTFRKIEFFMLCIAFLAFLFMGLYLFRNRRQLFFWFAFFFIVLSPVLTPFKIAWIVAERYAYLASLGIFVMLAYWLNIISAKNEINKYIFTSLFVLVMIALCARTIIRNTDWKNEDSLWVATAKTSPSGAQIHNNLGDMYARKGDLTKAAEEFQKAFLIDPNYAAAYHNFAHANQALGKDNIAIANYQKAIELDPRMWQSYKNLGVIHQKRNEIESARKNFEKALSLNPEDNDLKNLLYNLPPP